MLSRLRSESQASISEETPRRVSFSSSPFAVKLVNIAVTSRDFRKSTSRSSVAITSVVEPTVARFDRGSMITTLGANSCTQRKRVTRCISRPYSVGRLAWNCSSPRSTHCPRSSPIERMLRRICSGDSSMAK